MNGLKLIRTRCNYSQKALAEVLGVSRQAVNMWENSKKLISEDRQKEICELFGLDDVSLLGEISIDTIHELESRPLFKISKDENHERFSFKPIDKTTFSFCSPFFVESAQLSLDDKCALKRLELKKLFEDIGETAVICSTKNSYDNLHSLNRTLKVFNNVLDLYNEFRNKYPEYAMVYFHTLEAVLDATSISFGLATKEEILNIDIPEGAQKYYDYREFTVELSDAITQHLDNICEQIPTKKENPSANYRRRKK